MIGRLADVPHHEPGDPLGSPLARSVFEAAKEALLVLRPDGTVLAMNAAFGTLYGIDPNECVGRSYIDFAKGFEVRRHDTTIEPETYVSPRALRGESVEGVLQTLRNKATGHEFIGRYGATPLFEDGELVATTITVVDVTETIQARQRVEAALSAAEVGVWSIDFTRGRLWGDENFAQMHGLSDEEVNGIAFDRLASLIHPNDREQTVQAYSRAARLGEPHEIEFRIMGRDGRTRWLLSRGRTELASDGSLLMSIGTAVDVTSRKEAEEALRRSGETFESLVRNSPHGIYAVDADFRLALVSQGAQRVFENVRPLIGRDFAEVLRIVWEEPFASEAIRLFRHTLDTGESYHAPSTVETRHDLGQTEAYDWKIERVALPDGRLGVVCHFYDLSERQRQQEALERAVQERTAELTRANRDLDEFASSVAHDLRAPLRTVVLTSRLLMESAEGRLTPEERDMVERQSKGAVRLAGIVDDLLKFARLANAEFHSVPFDLTRAARRAATEVSGRGWVNPPTIEVEEGMRTQGDPNLVGYALTNLLDNACKFSPDGGAVAVGQRNGAFYVRDDGVGFDMEHAHKLFVAFERLVDQKTFQGTGLGLANVKRIVERHGGRVWAESEPGKGATFWFTLG